MASLEPLRLGVLGAPRIARVSLVEPAQLIGARLVAVAARDRERATAFAELNGIERVLASYADLVADREVEVVYNALVNVLHAPWNLAAIAAGKHVLSEKPFAVNAFEAGEVHLAGMRAGVRVADGFHYAHHPTIKRVHELVGAGALGDLKSVQVVFDVPAPGPGDHRWSLPLAGGALMDIGCYCLHAIRALRTWGGGEPIVTGGRGTEHGSLAGVDERASIELLFPNGARGYARCDMAAERVKIGYRVVGTAGEIEVANFAFPHRDSRLIVRTAEGERVEEFGSRTSYTYQLEAFTALVRAGTAMSTDSEEAVGTMRLVDDSYRAIGMALRPRWSSTD